MDDIKYNILKKQWKLIYESYVSVVNELSSIEDVQNEPSWNNPDYDKSILKTKPVYTFEATLKELGNIQIGFFKNEKSYIFINLETEEKIAEMDYKTINIMHNGKLLKNAECSYKGNVIGRYRGNGFSYIMLDTLLKHNTVNPGIWASDTKLSPINQKVWKNSLKKYKHDFLISNGKNPEIWIPTTDMQNIDKFRLRKINREILINPEKVWEEDYNEEKIRVLLKA